MASVGRELVVLLIVRADARSGQGVVQCGRIVIGRGRDALDVDMATTVGGPQLESMTVWARELG